VSEPVIRPGTPTDLAVLVDFVIAEAVEAEARTLDRATVERAVAAALADPELARYWVLEDAGEVLAAIAVTTEWSDWHAAAYWWVQFVFVDPTRRGQGTVDALMAAVEAAASSAGGAEIRLLVHPHNTRAVRAYEKLGFVAAPYLVMRRPLS
jgi:ribosomal protein S18 acetylase RimI-like enzyme